MQELPTSEQKPEVCKTDEGTETIELTEMQNELILLINKLGITHIYSHDDQWNDYKSGDLKVNETELLDIDLFDFFERYSITLTDEFKRIISNKGYTTLEELVDSDIKSLDKLINECLGYLELKRENRVLQSLDDLFQILHKFDINIVTSSEKFNKDDVPSVDGKILFLLDMNMEDTSGEKDVIIESIFDIKKSRPDMYDIAIVYSYENLAFYDDQEQKAKYVESYLTEKKIPIKFDLETEKYLFLHQLWSLSKTTRIDELSANLVTTLIRAAFGHSLHDYLEFKTKSARNVMLDLIKIKESTFEFLYHDSFVEGELFIEILERTKKSILNKVEINELQSPEYNLSIDNLFAVSTLKNKRILDEIKATGLKAFSKSNLEKKSNSGIYKGISEYGLVDYSVNKTYKDIMTGDIFKIIMHENNKTKYGVLISTDCDLLVRFVGNSLSDIKRNVDVVSLLLYDGYNIDSTDAKKIIKEKDGLWPIKDGDNYVVLDTKTKPILLNVDVRVLDLCSLNHQGWALIKPKEDFLYYKSHFFKHYFNKDISKWLLKILDINEYLPSDFNYDEMVAATKDDYDVTSKEKEAELKIYTENKVRNLNQLIDVFIGLKYFILHNRQQERLEILRIGRLETKRTLQLIQNNYNLISRIGVSTNPLA